MTTEKSQNPRVLKEPPEDYWVARTWKALLQIEGLGNCRACHEQHTRG